MHLVMHQFMFSFELGWLLRFVRRKFDNVQRAVTQNNYENANPKRIKA
jgi:hypothetical protein